MRATQFFPTEEKVDFKHHVFNSRGFTIVEILIAVGISAVIMMGLITATSSQLRVQSQSNLTFQLDSNRRELIRMLNTENGWVNTINDSANSSSCGSPSSTCNPLSCMNAPSTRISGKGGKIMTVRDLTTAPGQTLYTWTGSNGLTMQGAACSTFNPTPSSGNNNCPLQVQISWQAECAQPVGTACGTGDVIAKIKIEPVYNPAPGNNIVFNQGNYSAEFYQGSSTVGCDWTDTPAGLVETCKSVGIMQSVPGAGATLDVGGSTILRTPLNTTGSIGMDHGNVFSLASNYGAGAGQKYLNVALENIPYPTESVVFRNPFTNTGINDSWLLSFGIIHPPILGEQIGFFGGAQNGPNDRITVGKGSVVIGTGNLSIGAAVTSNRLEVGGDINTSGNYQIGGTVICSSSGCTAVSDESLKKNVLPLEDSLSKILDLRAVSYDWKDTKRFGNRHQIGFIAQEVEKIFPEVVVKDKSSGLKSIAYDHLVAPLVEALQTLAQRLDVVERQSSKQASSQSVELENLRQQFVELQNREKTQQQELENLKKLVQDLKKN